MPKIRKKEPYGARGVGDSRTPRFNMITVLFPDGPNDSCAQENGFCTHLEERRFVARGRGEKPCTELYSLKDKVFWSRELKMETK